MKKKNVSKGFPALLAGIASMALLFAGCSPDSEPDPNPAPVVVPGSSYTVSFNANGGSPAPQAQQVSTGGLIAEPAPMTKEGHSFDGWFKEANFVTRWDFASGTVTANITLYAQWIPSITSVKELSEYLAAQSGGDSENAPLTAAVSVELSAENWSGILSALNTAGKYVALDLAACTASTHSSGGGLYTDGTFDPNRDAGTGKGWIVRLVLPDAAASIAAGTDNGYYNATFTGFTRLKSVSGAKVTDIGGNAFDNCKSLTSVSFPAAATIGSQAFLDCIGLTSVSLPAATSIGGQVFRNTGTAALSVTLGSKAPTVGTGMFVFVDAAKAVTVRYPAGASGYGTAPTETSAGNWGNAFRGKGWDGTSYLTGTVNSYITLTYQTAP